MITIALSFLIGLFAQPDLSIFCCLLASGLSYALFWRGMLSFESKRSRFFLGFVWFAIITAFHLSWFASDRYVGAFIFFVLAFLSLSMGAFFATLSLFVKKEMNLLNCASLAAVWTIFEWSRLFFLSGFSFDPIGLSLTATLYGMQFVSIAGVFGLTFWVVFSNLVGVRSFSKLWLGMVLFPYAFGFFHLAFHQKKIESAPKLSALLVQTSLYPEEKMRFPFSTKPPLSPLEQWKRICAHLKKHEGKNIDLIVMPEATVPYGTFVPLFPAEALEEFAPKKRSGKVGNAAFAQGLSDHFNADVMVGLDDSDYTSVYNAAFLFRPHEEKPLRYEKRVLVPMGEYIPFEWCKRVLERYGIADSFVRGESAKIFRGKKALLSPSICYEETYGHLMRECRKGGAELLLNLTNDVWYPHSRLAVIHYLHGKLRAVEGGVPLVRATNTGVTVGVDALGRELGKLPHETWRQDAPADVLHVEVPLYCYPTLYLVTGDWGIISLSFVLVLAFGFTILRACACASARA